MIHLDIVAEEIGRCIPAGVALWGDARAKLEDLTDALSDSSAAARGSRADYVAELAPRMKAWEDDAAPRLNFARPAGAHGAPLPRAEQDPAGGRDPGCRWWVRRTLDRPAMRHQECGTEFHPGSRLRLDRLWAARRYGRSLGGARPARRRDQRRWRLQHDAWRTRNRAPHRVRILL